MHACGSGNEGSLCIVKIRVGGCTGDTGAGAVQVCAAELLCADDLAGGGLDEGGAPEEDGAVGAHDNGFVGHGGHVRAPRGAGAHHHRNLRDASCRHLRLHAACHSDTLLVMATFAGG